MAKEKKTNQTTPVQKANEYFGGVVGGIIAFLIFAVVIILLVALIRGLIITLF